MGPVLSRDDLEELSDSAAGAEDPAAVAAALIEAARAGRLADAADAGYAYLLAAEIHERAEDLGSALALTEQALSAYRRSGVAALTQPRNYRARLLLQLGREEEAMRELAALRPADGEGFEDGFEAPDGDEAGGAKEGGDYAADYQDGYADDGEPVEAALLVWPREAYEQVDQRWPEVLEATGAQTWEEYRRYCQGLIRSWSRPGRGPLYLVTGDADGFEEWLAEQGADPYQENLVVLARGYGDHLAEQGDPVELPPGHDDPCWCASGLSYGRCCRRLPA